MRQKTMYAERGELKYISNGDGARKNHYHMLSEGLVQTEFKDQLCPN